MATALTVTIPVFVIGTNGLPIYFVTLVTLSGVESATGLAQVLLNPVGAVLLPLVALSYRRRLRGDCPRCGGPHAGREDGPLAHPAASPTPKRTRAAAYLLMCGLLLLGLLHTWGQVLPLLSGRRVPRLLPLVPAVLTGVPLTMYGALLTLTAPLIALGVLPAAKPSAPTPPAPTPSARAPPGDGAPGGDSAIRLVNRRPGAMNTAGCTHVRGVWCASQITRRGTGAFR